ncbi:MAG: tyrosine-protein phosphatase [Actinobacteria bacterium]|nr:tyrosine-protein phosphatase [Actinomycetota bacterium]
MNNARWVRLDGAANVRDLGGLPTDDGRRTVFGRVLRADNLQELTAADRRLLVDTLGLRTVIDLRTSAEVAGEGPGPLTREPLVVHRHHSLYPEREGQPEPVPPWRADGDGEALWSGVGGLARSYLNYLYHRPDSVVAALTGMAHPDHGGAALVHCAAGKDRTGAVTALALAVAGVDREAIVADYVASGEVIEAILDRLRRRPMYAEGLGGADNHRPRARTMEDFLAVLDAEHGGPLRWLGHAGFGPSEQSALRARLLS